jgi:hypothetical protein
MKTEIPIACSLTDKELGERRKNVLQKTARSLTSVEELENGFSYQFPAEDSVLQDLITVVNLERKCCAFLNFNLVVKADSEIVSLELTGDDGTKEALRQLFNWN